MLKTTFWRRAAASLPPQVRTRYAADLETAERLDLAVSAALDWLKRMVAPAAPRPRRIAKWSRPSAS